MEFLIDNRPLWAVLIPLCLSVLILICHHFPNMREFWTLVAAAFKVGIVYSMIPTILAGNVLMSATLELAPGISLCLRADAAGMVFAALASLLWFITSFFSIGYMRSLKELHQTGYYFSFAICLSATMGIAFAGNLLTFIVFFELLTLATYPLVAHHRDQESLKASRRYLVYTIIGGQLTLLGIAFVYYLTGSLEFIPGGFMNTDTASKTVLVIVFLLLLAGPAVKAGLMPFHGWLPSAMVAPTPVSALLHAVAVVKAGCFGIIRMVGYVFGPATMQAIGMDTFLVAIASFTIITASVIALTQNHLKQRLAFSTISQLSYIVLGIGLMNPMTMAAGIFHLFAHGMMKITLFFTAGAIYTKTHDLRINMLSGLGRVMPFTFTAYTICSLGIAGMPFTVGFISKWNILMGAVEDGKLWVIALLLVSAVLTCAYLLSVSYKAFFGKVVPSMQHIKGEPNLLCLFPLLTACFLSLVFGIFPDFAENFYQLAQMAAANIFNGFFGLGG